jgi:hypothetical protein
MKHTRNPPHPVEPTLAEQKSDFTAEGAPPPGKVATSTPEVPPGDPPGATPPPTRGRTRTRPARQP